MKVEIHCDDIIKFIQNCNSPSEIQRIHDVTVSEGADCDTEDGQYHDLSELKTYNECAKSQGYPVIETLADSMKMDFIASVWDEFTLEQLEERLKITKKQ